MNPMNPSNPTTAEEVIDPDLPICDSHHHLWDGPGERGRYLLDEFLRDVGGGHRIVSTVFIECGTGYRHEGPEKMRPVGETEFVKSLVAQNTVREGNPPAVAAGIVGFADLTLGKDIAPVLEAHLAAGGARFRGVRQSCTWDDDLSIFSLGRRGEMMAEGLFREGFACLERYGLTFDAWQYFTQLGELTELVQAFPGTTFVVNHTGGPIGIGRYVGKGREVFQEWKRGMRGLASCPNVVVKLGGLGMPRCGFGWHERNRPPGSAELAEAMAPYFHFCIEVFGARRCMFESNFPVDKVSYSYTVMWNAFKRICKGCSEEERTALFHDTAVKVYRIGDAPWT
jgi:predicted TIM-barrel fold metal-dependent hydrolase